MSSNTRCSCGGGMSYGSGFGGGFGGVLGGGFGQSSNCICSLPTLIILILIVLQFSRNNDSDCCRKYDEED